MNCSDDLVCPTCHQRKKLYDHVRRYVRGYHDQRFTLYVPRYKCQCGLHRVLPKKAVPFKHFEAEVIENVVDGLISPGDEEIENHPCESTAVRWKRWIAGNKAQIDGALAAVHNRYRIFKHTQLDMTVSLLEQLREIEDDWLQIVDLILWNLNLPLLNMHQLKFHREIMNRIPSGPDPPTLRCVH